MASKQVKLNSSTYTKLDTGSATAFDCQNISGRSPVRIIFSASLPDPDAVGYYYLEGHQAVLRDGKTDDMYGRSDREGATFVTVGE